MSAMSFNEALTEIAVFPLPRVVLFPGAALPLHIFEPRYRVMLKDCLASHRALAIGQSAEDGAIVGGGLVVEHHQLPDGRSNILVVGEARLRLEEVTAEDLPRYPYKRARAVVLQDLAFAVSEKDKTALVAAATMFASEVKKHDASFSFNVPPTATATAGELADVCAYQLVVDPDVRQAVLEDLDPRSRVERVTNQIALQHGAMIRDAPGSSKVLN
jgi:Lon protease-like protein